MYCVEKGFGARFAACLIMRISKKCVRKIFGNQIRNKSGEIALVLRRLVRAVESGCSWCWLGVSGWWCGAAGNVSCGALTELLLWRRRLLHRAE